MRFPVFAAMGLLALARLHASERGEDLAGKLVGEWQGSRHIEAYYVDGSFTLDPILGDKPHGTWKLDGHRLTTQLDDADKPMVVRIEKISDTEMITIYNGRRFAHKRVAHQ
jgi:hypothetical protein